jgi:hypothetical protein
MTASKTCQSLKHMRVTVHRLRHTMAMDLLQAGVDRAVIALWLGHESVETTQIYLEATLAMKARALGKVTPPHAERPVINPAINSSVSSTACRVAKTMSGDTLTASAL